MLWGWEVGLLLGCPLPCSKAVMMAAALSSSSKAVSLLILLTFQSCVYFSSMFSSCSVEWGSAGFTGAVVLFRLGGVIC